MNDRVEAACLCWDESAAALEKAATINPHHRTYQAALCQLYKALAQARQELGAHREAAAAAARLAVWEKIRDRRQ
jgi:hypothetical protein